MSADIRIGTSGWHYKHWLGPFYPEKLAASKTLAFYQERFDTVEVNNSFYHLPPESGMRRWHDTTPDHFLFALKGSRFLTHMKKLKDPETGLERFFERADLLQDKLGPIVFQLPPQWEVDAGRLAHFVRALPRYHRYAFEFQNPTWESDEIYSLLREHNIAQCPFHLAGYQSPIVITANFTYLRLHGPGGKYQGSYSDGALGEWSSRIQQWRRELDAVFVYFDNDQAGYAVHDALRLKQMVFG